MKMTLIALCFLCATAAWGQQSPSMNSQQFNDHSQHASYQSMSQPANILGGTEIVIGHGEVPLADIPMPEVRETPLGDVARQVRKEHLAAKKARKVWESQILGPDAVQVIR